MACRLIKEGGEGKAEVAEEKEEELGLKVRWGGRVARIWKLNGKSGWFGVSWDLRSRSTYRERIFILQQRKKWSVFSSPISFNQLS